jgi:hypothetical protein
VDDDEEPDGLAWLETYELPEPEGRGGPDDLIEEDWDNLW